MPSLLIPHKRSNPILHYSLPLPNEVTEKIFLLLIRRRKSTGRNKHFTDVLSLAATSRTLHDIAYSFKQLWALRLDFADSIPCIERNIALSNPIPLSISLPNFSCVRECCQEGLSPRNRHSRFPTWELLFTRNILESRCRSLNVNVDFCMWNTLSVRLEPHLSSIAELQISFPVEDIPFGHSGSSSWIPPKELAQKFSCANLTSLTVIGPFFHLNPAMYPVLRHLSVHMVVARRNRGYNYNPTNLHLNQLIYENLPANQWHDLLLTLPTLESVSLKYAIQYTDAYNLDADELLESVRLTNLKSFKIEDLHGCVSRFLGPCIMSPECDIRIQSVFSKEKSDLNRFEGVNRQGLPRFFRNRFCSIVEPSSFGSKASVKICQYLSSSIPEAWNVVITNHSKENIATPISVEFLIPFKDHSESKWKQKRKACYFAYWLCTFALEAPLSEVGDVLLDIEVDAASSDQRRGRLKSDTYYSYTKLCGKLKGLVRNKDLEIMFA